MSEETDTIELEGHIVSKRLNIKKQDEVKLWVRSGGRCAICNKYLLDLNFDVSIGEMAHIVGWSKAAKSPRGQAELALEDRNTVDNLVLLCADHHKIVDTKALLEEFTLERLMQHKANHEHRIYHLTALQIDSESVVLRMLGGIRGATVEVSKEHARNVVFNSEQKFAMFIDSFDKHGIEIDLNLMPDPEDNWEAYWSMGQSIIDKCLRPLIGGVEKGQVRHISVFALSRIPLLIYLGYKLDDKIPTSLYQKHRGDEETWMWSEKEKIETFEVIQLKESQTSKVALILSLSGSIDIENLPTEVLEDSNVYELKPVITTPNRNILRNKASYENFGKCYHDFLSRLETIHKSCDTIHLFAATPVAAAISCGRGLMRDAQPAITIYDLSATIYKPTITINAK
ncbi:SAVED domain-containing protein [Pedobacter sp. SD-b]|uniref:SAVED domain-containing protein n=1 Tax=Pedobacter segetis TaxID=2793069 RepID=A0ABS1BJ11_9SPHI|nr:SAVED domain-containing protein [Pedobacter segetis]MBK0382873.1 SAVED domain-containing protein [Pedobacter segetis]